MRVSPTPRDVVERWMSAINRRDLEAVASCFAEDYEDEAPARRGEFVHGREQVRSNFQRFFSSMPDIRAILRAVVEDGNTVWMEWEMRGIRPDGTEMEFVGVNVFQVSEGMLSRGRIYTELVRDLGGLDAQVDKMAKDG